MGHAATWAVVVDGVFLDPVTFKPLPLTYPNKGERAWHAQELPVYASADGTAYGRWGANRCSTRIIEGSEVKYIEGWIPTHILPGPTGRWFYTTKGPITRELKVATPADEKYGYCLPATSGDYFLSLTSTDDKGKGGSITIYHRGASGPIGRLDKVDHGVKFDGWDRDPYGPWRRVFFIPEAKVIAVLPNGNDRVVLHKFDIDDALNKSGIDYLFVTSQPPLSAKAGTTYTYPLVVKSNQGGLTFARLDSGPKGMTVSPTGVVTWAVPADVTGDQEVILLVKDKSGQEAFHNFTVRVAK